MHRQLIAAAFALAAAPSIAAAQQEQDAAAETAADSVIEPAGLTQVLGGRLGIEVGGRTTPGGLHVAGSYLYLLDGPWWFDTGIGFTFGGGSASCFRDRDNDVVCDHGIAAGFAAEVVGSIRRELGERQGFVPFVRGGVALRLLAFSSDDVVGLGFPLIGSAGFRRRLSDLVTLVAAADLRIGWGVLNRDLGVEAQASASLTAGVEFDLD